MIRTEYKTRPNFSREFLNSLYEMPDGDRVQTCIQCGTCVGICPFGNWMEFPPREIIAYLRADMFEDILASETFWMCVSCYACSEKCPQEIPLTSILLTRLKEELILSGNIPAELQEALENSQRYGNPMGNSARKRIAWAKDVTPPIPILAKKKRPVDVLWFVGDYASYHPAAIQSTRAFQKMLNALEVDFGVLGQEEVSDGDTQRMAGEKGLFEWLAEKNRKAFEKYEFNQIITTDPHAYNAFKNEYPKLGIEYPVQHYTQFLADRLDQLKPLLVNDINAIVAYHDPCYLGRVNGVFDEPRELLQAIPGIELFEMTHNGTSSLCCGGGGGGMWLDGFQWDIAKVRLSEWRVREVVAARPVYDFLETLSVFSKLKRKSTKVEEPDTRNRILAVACPYEKPRFEDAVKTVPEAGELKVMDIAELLALSMDFDLAPKRRRRL